MDVEFSGVVTSVMHLYNKGVSREDLCYSLQETLFSMVVEVTERAMAHTGKTAALVIGGVGANQRFCEMLTLMCRDRDAQAFACPLPYCGDNGTMIAWLGCLRFLKRKYDDLSLDYNDRLRIDDVFVDWL